MMELDAHKSNGAATVGYGTPYAVAPATPNPRPRVFEEVLFGRGVLKSVTNVVITYTLHVVSP
jgi:hypothetical protein